MQNQIKSYVMKNKKSKCGMYKDEVADTCKEYFKEQLIVVIL